MNDFRDYFFAESVERLDRLESALNENFSDQTRREAFRLLHTIKGTAQTFGLENTARTAHELEQFLVAENQLNENSAKKLIENIAVLRATFDESATASARIADFGTAQNKDGEAERIVGFAPDGFVKKLSEQEKKALTLALRAGKNILRAEVAFKATNFAADYKELFANLDKNGEVIAALPGKKIGAPGTIDFEIYFASGEKARDLEKKVEKFAAKITPEIPVTESAFAIRQVIEEIIAHGRSVAENLNKTVEFTNAIEEFFVAPETLKVIFEALLHLIRNAIDHGIEQRGKIEITANCSENEIFLTLSDDGKGIDAAEILRHAVAKRLVSDDGNWSDAAVVELIFQPGFSTARNVSAISGRGVGLDAVKKTIENAGGKIGVKSEKGKGTIFEIILPNEKK